MQKMQENEKNQRKYKNINNKKILGCKYYSIAIRL